MAERLGADNPALRALVNEASQSGTPLMLRHVDIDHFASVNENMSEAVGDMALALIAQRLRDMEGSPVSVTIKSRTVRLWRIPSFKRQDAPFHVKIESKESPF